MSILLVGGAGGNVMRGRIFLKEDERRGGGGDRRHHPRNVQKNVPPPVLMLGIRDTSLEGIEGTSPSSSFLKRHWGGRGKPSSACVRSAVLLKKRGVT